VKAASKSARGSQQTDETTPKTARGSRKADESPSKATRSASKAEEAAPKTARGSSKAGQTTPKTARGNKGEVEDSPKTAPGSGRKETPAKETGKAERESKEAPRKDLLDARTQARGAVTEKDETPKAPKEPRQRAPREAKPAKAPEESLSLAALVSREVAEEEEGRARLGGKLPVERRAAPSRANGSPGQRGAAEEMAQRQREISVSEFFAKNRHLLGFDSPAKSLLTAIKEAVDNSLDACEEAGILPTISVELVEVAPEKFRVAVEDNGPGIVKAQVPKIFGKLLYGSKFHRLRQSRGQQGIGISAAVMYGQLTTGKAACITSRPGEEAPASYCELVIDTRSNRPEVSREKASVDWRPGSGTRIEIELSGIYKKGRHSVDAYLQQTAIANPHAEISYKAPKGDDWVIYQRQAPTLPKTPVESKPHPHGVELGFLLQKLRDTEAGALGDVLLVDFSRLNERAVLDVCAKAKLPPNAKPRKLSVEEVERLYAVLQEAKLPPPPTNCLSPIGEDLIRKGLESGVEGAEFYTAVTRPPAIYRGTPFQVEVGMAYGGKLPADEPCDLYRFANRVPLLYQQAACSVSKSVISAGWRAYGLSQPKGALPVGPLVLVVHIASVWVPFTSESKEAIAHYPEILREVRLAVQEAGRALGSHIRRLKRFSAEHKKRSYIDKYIPRIGEALREILGLPSQEEARLVSTLRETLERSRRENLPAALRKAEDEELAQAAPGEGEGDEAGAEASPDEDMTSPEVGSSVLAVAKPARKKKAAPRAGARVS
jgi:DNA topoisomerase-6 subunit B